jgi:hypothetical protein
MMRSWGNRPDTFVCDEPLYAHYLLRTGRQHPGADEVIRCHETNWRKVVMWLTGEAPEGKIIFYQKHMAHHLLPDMARDWLNHLTHCLLIRHPREVLASYLKVEGVAEPRLEDLGLPQQIEIDRLVREQSGRTTPIIDARDLLQEPKSMLSLLCQALEVAFTDAMLSWPPGPRSTDGVWAKYWYASVEHSTGFAPYRENAEPIPERHRDLYERALLLYQGLYERRLR